MDMQPLAGACFSVETNVVFIFTGNKRHHFEAFVKSFFTPVFGGINSASQSLSAVGVVVNYPPA